VPLLEYPFDDRHKDKLAACFGKETILNIRLDLPIEEAYRRFHERDLSGMRHLGHYYQTYPPKSGDKPSYQSFEDYQKAMRRLNVADFELGKTLKIDAGSFPLPIEKICDFIENSDN